MKSIQCLLIGIMMSISLSVLAQDVEIKKKPVDDIIQDMETANASKAETDLFQYRIFDEIKPMHQGSNPAYVVEFGGLKDGEVKSMFNDFMKDYGKKPKKVKKSDEFQVEDARLPGVNAGRSFEIYNAFYEVGERVQTVVWAKTKDEFISKDSEYHDAMVENMQQYLQFLMFKKTENDLKDEEKILKDFEKDLDKLNKDREKSLANIEDYKQKILEEEANVRTAEQDIQYKEDDIQVQKASRTIVEKRLNDYKAKAGIEKGMLKGILKKN